MYDRFESHPADTTHLSGKHRVGSRMLLVQVLAAVADPAMLEVLRDALLSGQEAGVAVLALRDRIKRSILDN